ncbi:hypothetical protein BHM03_00060055, partial [Ensete ventricosum]
DGPNRKPRLSPPPPLSALLASPTKHKGNRGFRIRSSLRFETLAWLIEGDEQPRRPSPKKERPRRPPALGGGQEDRPVGERRHNCRRHRRERHQAGFPYPSFVGLLDPLFPFVQVCSFVWFLSWLILVVLEQWGEDGEEPEAVESFDYSRGHDCLRCVSEDDRAKSGFRASNGCDSKDVLMRVVAQNLSPELTLVEKVPLC